MISARPRPVPRTRSPRRSAQDRPCARPVRAARDRRAPRGVRREQLLAGANGQNPGAAVIVVAAAASASLHCSTIRPSALLRQCELEDDIGTLHSRRNLREEPLEDRAPVRRRRRAGEAGGEEAPPTRHSGIVWSQLGGELVQLGCGRRGPAGGSLLGGGLQLRRDGCIRPLCGEGRWRARSSSPRLPPPALCARLGASRRRLLVADRGEQR